MLPGKARGYGAARGAAFRIAVALLADEGAVPLLGWSDPPARTPWRIHVYGLASHIVFGVTLEAGRRLLAKVG